MTHIKIEKLKIHASHIQIGPEINAVLYSDQNYCVFGPSGIGKSLFLQTLLGVHDQFSGKIEGRLDYKKHGYLPSNIVFPDISIAEYLHFLDHSKVSLDVIFKNAEKLSLNLKAFKSDAKMNTLSDGEKKRLALSIAGSRNYEYIILDEPLGGLDLQNRASAAEFITMLEGSKIIVSHHPDIFISHGFVGLEMTDSSMEAR